MSNEHLAVEPQLSSLLLEIGTEEIPARFLPLASSMLLENAGKIFNEYFIEFSDIKTYTTPRRLALFVKGMPPVQKDRVKEVFGPPRKAAFDGDGNPTKAAAGFAQSQGVEVSSLVMKQKDKGEYIVAVIRQEGVQVKDLLQEALKKIILALSFPKMMRWGDGDFRFVRPVHWIAALFNGNIITFEIDGIKSGNTTRGHRFLSPGILAIKEISSYINLLENNYVIADQDERRKIIEKGIAGLSASVGGKALRDEGLLETVNCLVEYPVPVLCEFPPDYLRLPKELLITVMKDHQKYFAVEDNAGRLKNNFIVICNTKEENSGTIKIGAERVIKARFEDARFYYEEDIKKPLHTRIEDLKRVTFHDKLGTLHDKTVRVVNLASFLSERLFPGKKENVERSAWLCKTDLISGAVGEFPELQGLMGRYYALHDGEAAEVAEAIIEQYLPAHAGDRLPATDEGSILSLADKMDNLVSFFSAGLTPTGSEDPFALRRQAIAVLSILMEKGYAVTLREIIQQAAKNIKSASKSFPEEMLGFFAQRLEPILSSRNYETDIIQSVMYHVHNLPLREIIGRLDAVQRFTSDSGYTSFLLAVKRVNNIIPETKIPALKRTLLSEPQEKTLHNELFKIKPAFGDLLDRGNYHEALKVLSTITEPVNNFFDKVLVMDKRDEVKLNRFALLKEIWLMTTTIADFSKLKENR